uniref:Uncharacterized protein n=1 Tax=Anopheles farauti TaxID=69004 RepID=A0A182Q7C3_9DIPT
MLVLFWCSSIYVSTEIERKAAIAASRHNRELRTALVDLFGESDHRPIDTPEEPADGGRNLAEWRAEKKALKELYYLAKVLQAYRLPHAHGSAVFRGVIDRITDGELLEQLERTLRKEKGFEVISQIGTNGTAPDRFQVQLANDFRLLAPVLVRTLRRLQGFQHIPESLRASETNNFLYDLQLDVQHEWLALREALSNLEQHRIGVAQPEDLNVGFPPEDDDTSWIKNPIAGGYQLSDGKEWETRNERTPDSLSWEIEERRGTPVILHPEPQQQQQQPVVIIQQSTTKVSESVAPAALPSKVRPSGGPPVSSLAIQLTAQMDRATRQLIAVELDKFLLRVEDVSGVDGFAREFDREDRLRMIGWVRQSYSPAVGLDQVEFVRALRRLLKTKQLRRGRLDVLEALNYLQSQYNKDRDRYHGSNHDDFT